MTNSSESFSKRRCPPQENLDKRIERAKYVYEQTNGWIENADNKVATSTGITFGAFGIITFLADNAPSPDSSAVPIAWISAVYNLCFVVSIVAMIAALFCYTAAIFPHLKSGCEREEVPKFPLYYGDISSITKDEFKRQVYRAGDGGFLEGIADDAYVNAQTCLKKMKCYRVGLVLSFAAVGLAILSLLARYKMYG